MTRSVGPRPFGVPVDNEGTNGDFHHADTTTWLHANVWDLASALLATGRHNLALEALALAGHDPERFRDLLERHHA